MMSLDVMTPGTEGTLVRVGGERAFRCRLMELGLLPGTSVRVVRRLDVGGVLELEVRGCRLSVRRGEAAQVFVAKKKG
jgi:Fe2+ transport system protein FeoA